MSKCLILYFSQSGSTARVAESIAAGLRQAQLDVHLHDMRDGRPPNPSGYDLLGVGSPTYYYQPPYNVIDTVEKLPDLSGLPAFVFVLHGTYRGNTGTVLRRALNRKGVHEVGYFHCHGADYALGYLREGVLFSPDHPTVEDLARAESFGRDVASRLHRRPDTRPKADPPPALIHRLQRLLANRWLARNLYTRCFRVDPQRCTSCGRCVADCPTGNITPDQDGMPVWGRECLVCLYCEMNCPEEAIHSALSWPFVRLLFRRNVQRAVRDPALKHARVQHRKGRTILL